MVETRWGEIRHLSSLGASFPLRHSGSPRLPAKARFAPDSLRSEPGARGWKKSHFFSSPFGRAPSPGPPARPGLVPSGTRGTAGAEAVRGPLVPVGSLCCGPQVAADGRGWGTGTVGLSPELGHQTPTTESPSQKLDRRGATALSIIREGEDEEREHLRAKPKRQQTQLPSEGESGIRATVPATSATLEGCKYWGCRGAEGSPGPC